MSGLFPGHRDRRVIRHSTFLAIVFAFSSLTPAFAQSGVTLPPSFTGPAARITGLVAATLLYLVLLKLVNWLRQRAVRATDRIYQRAVANRMTARDPENVRSRVVAAATKVSGLVRNITVLLLTYIYLTTVLSSLPVAQTFIAVFTRSSLALLASAWQGFVDYLPNLCILIVVAVAVRYISIVLDFFFDEIGRGTISLPGFYAEWAEPTHNLLLFLMYILAGTIAFPYLPGFDTPAFQGITLFGAILGALGARESVSDIISGIVLIYTRPFLLGDRISITDIKGTVVEKTLFVTRVRTPKNAIVTIPNRVLRDSDVINHSACLREDGVPPIVPVTVTIGYDVPWQEVYQALLAAAQQTETVSQEPAPFVLQTGLGDFSVAYELNVYTQHPDRMERVFSELNQNIQDCCNAAGIEILSPGFAAIRDGNQTTIPAQYPQADPTPAFRVESVDRQPSQ